MIRYTAVRNDSEADMDLTYCFGSRISDTIPKYMGVADDENRIMLMAPIASTKVGLPTTWNPVLQGPVCGASEGRSCTPTATVRMMTEAIIDVMPAQPTHETFERVRIEPRRKPAMAATAVNTAVHAPWDDMAFRAVDTPTIADAVQNTMTNVRLVPLMVLTDREDNVEDLTANAAAKDVSRVREAVHLRMAHLERAKERRAVCESAMHLIVVTHSRA